MVLTFVAQDFSSAAPPIFLPYAISPQISSVACGQWQPQKDQTQKPPTEEIDSQATLDCPFSWSPHQAWAARFQALSWGWLMPGYPPHPAFPPVSQRGPRMGPTPCLLTLTGIGPQTHRSTILALASALFWYFYFWYIILNSFVKPNHWIQSNAMECLPWDWSFSKCPHSSQQALLYPGDGSLFPRKAQAYVGTFFSNYKAAEWVSWRFSSSFSPRLSIPVLVTDGTLLSAGSAVRVGVEQYRIKPTMMMVKDRM